MFLDYPEQELLIFLTRSLRQDLLSKEDKSCEHMRCGDLRKWPRKSIQHD